MNPAHLHLALNHLPVVATLIATVLLGVALWRHADGVLRTGAAVALGAALVTVPVYLSGDPAEDQVEDLSGVSEHAIERHEDAAGAAAVSVVVLGLAAAFCLVRYRSGAVPRPAAVSLVVLALVATALFARTANLGGEIRHPEIRGGAGVTQPQDAPPAE